VYRTENAKPNDYVMPGTHDTKPIWAVVDDWFKDPEMAAKHAVYLAERLRPAEAGYSIQDRLLLGSIFQLNPVAMAQAKIAELFASPAKNVAMFMTDFFGYKEQHNLPNTLDANLNWSLRLPSNYRDEYYDKVAKGEAVNLAEALVQAMISKGSDFVRQHEDTFKSLRYVSDVLQDKDTKDPEQFQRDHADVIARLKQQPAKVS
jgi:4-alpha-glucanotransferase